jgi:hypothetical protein
MTRPDSAVLYLLLPEPVPIPSWSHVIFHDFPGTLGKPGRGVGDKNRGRRPRPSPSPSGAYRLALAFGVQPAAVQSAK